MPQWPILKNRAPDPAEPTPSADAPAEQELVIGKSLRFRGDLEVAAHLRIEGTVKGCINASLFDVVIEADGVAEANVHAGNVTVRGRVVGAILAEGTVHLEASAEVHGPIHAARVVLDDGCLLAGRVDVSSGITSGAPAPAEPLISPRGIDRSRPDPGIGHDLRSLHDH